MRRGFTHHLFAVGVVALFLSLHLWWRWKGVSILPWPMVIPTFVAGTYRASLALFLIFVALGEFFSFLPPGVLTVIILVPYLILRFLPSAVRLWSPQLWLFVGVAVALQLIINLTVFVWGNFEYPPFFHLASQWAMSTLAVSLAVAIWQELNPSG